MKLIPALSFGRDLAKLSPQVQKQVQKKLALLLENPQHPSLDLKKMQGQGDIWRMKITAGYRLTLQIHQEACILRRVGPHDILKKP